MEEFTNLFVNLNSTVFRKFLLEILNIKVFFIFESCVYNFERHIISSVLIPSEK